MGNCTSNNDGYITQIESDIDHEIKQDKENIDKHSKYIKKYPSEKHLFWGLGIENELYLKFKALRTHASFKNLELKRERYSVDYYESFKEIEDLINFLKTKENLTFPIYVNSHTFTKTDVNGEHSTLYQKNSPPNPKFKKSIFDLLMEEKGFFYNNYNKNIVFDGDSIEFMTQNFHNTTVDECVRELSNIKSNFIEDSNFILGKYSWEKLEFPDHNYGLVSFRTTNGRNLGLCNNGTYHINITLPTYLQKDKIIDKKSFIKTHMNFIRVLQIIEGLIIGCYGTPDIFSILDNRYSFGSLRSSLSRYISLLSYKTYKYKNGKLLTKKVPKDPNFWYNKFHLDSPYNKCKEIGYDINFNKFKNHGVEIRFLDWFPDKYLKDLVNFIILLAQHSLEIGDITKDIESDGYLDELHEITLNCVKYGFKLKLSEIECKRLLQLLKINELVEGSKTIFELLNIINDYLFQRYQNGEFVKLISPNIQKPTLINYNLRAFQKLCFDIYGKPQLILRAETKLFEYRTPLVPKDIFELNKYFKIFVETSEQRCFKDSEYHINGGIIVSQGFWKNSKDSFILGLKELDEKVKPSQTHLYFAHCFKDQKDSKKIMNNLKDGILLDFEFMVNKDNERVLSFGKQSGRVGCYLGIITFYKIIENQRKIPDFDISIYDDILKSKINKPKVLIIGNGRVSMGCQEVLKKFNISFTIWTRKHTKFIDKTKLLEFDVFINAINLDNKINQSFFTKQDIFNLNRKLKVIVDISCDINHPKNPLPIYNNLTTKENPSLQLCKNPPLEIISIDNLPSLDPVVSSEEFSHILKDYLIHLSDYWYTYHLIPESYTLKNCENIYFQQKKINL